jgi:hypothetical protein
MIVTFKTKNNLLVVTPLAAVVVAAFVVAVANKQVVT